MAKRCSRERPKVDGFLKLGTCWFWCGHRMGTFRVSGVWAARLNCDFNITMGWNLIGDANQQLNLRHILNFDVWWTNNIRFAASIGGESFLGTSVEITCQHRNRRILKLLPKTEKIADNFQICRNRVFSTSQWDETWLVMQINSLIWDTFWILMFDEPTT